ncbi:DUF1853 family protein [Vibrio sp.]|nr:DUF1853 family protein [Vibrio sp.]
MELNKIAQWVLRTPTLFTASPNTPIVEYFPANINDQPSYPDIGNEYTGNYRLGFVYQYVCEQLIRHHPNYSILAEEIQLNKENGQTLGAIDLILSNLNTEGIEHWEVAIKFYLLKEGIWYGPNAHDQLDKKLDRMLSHQLMMSQTTLFKEQYPQWPQLDPKLLIQGRLYTNPFENEPVPNQCLNASLNTERIKGYWCYRSQVHLITSKLYHLNKPEWITGKTQDSKEVTEFGEKFIHCQDENGVFWFIMPEHWPESTKVKS